MKLSSEVAEYISVTPVVAREMPVRELVEQILGVTGKDETRIRDLLLRGTLVSGASRFRWAGWDVNPQDLRALLATFPDPDPARPFAPGLCTRVVLRGGPRPIEIPREVGLRKPLLRNQSLWDLLMEVAGAGSPQYLDYSYREQSDHYQLRLSSEAGERVRNSARLVKYTVLKEQIRGAVLEWADLFVRRG